jgi:SAM-dependent methyltransferase
LNSTVYSEAALYDLAFSYRDYDAEVASFCEWFQQINSSAQNPRSVLELACGPGRHLGAFSKMNSSLSGLDISKEMCGFAQSHVLQNTNAQIDCGDMTAFELGRQVDLVLLAINSVHHIPTSPKLKSNFECVFRHLNPNGIYIIEASRQPAPIESGGAEWRRERDQDYVDVIWRWDNEFDYVQMNGMINGCEIKLEAQFPMKHWQTDELIEAAKENGLSFIAYLEESGMALEGYSAQLVQLKSDQPIHDCLVFQKHS